jgi:glycosyltransferase involved in cell wall biosynthesis
VTAPSPISHVVHVVLSLDVGGLERVVLNLARHGRHQQRRITILCITHPGTLAQEAEQYGIPIVSLNKPPGRHPSLRIAAHTLLESLAPTVIHTHQIGPAWYVGPASESLTIPIIHTEHGDPFAREPRWISRWKLRWFYRTTAKHLQHVACVSEPIANAIRAWRTVAAKKVSVVANGIPLLDLPHDASHQPDEPPRTVTIGTVGRLNEVKRQDLLLRAFAELRADSPNLRLLLVGEGSERAKLESLARELGIESETEFAGYQADPAPYLARMDVFALTSRSEGFPVSLLEAWRAKRAVVSTAVGGIPQIVTDHVDGCLVRSLEPSAIASTLRTVLRDASLRNRLGMAGYSTLCQKYSLEAMAAAYDRLYGDAVAARQR